MHIGKVFEFVLNASSRDRFFQRFLFILALATLAVVAMLYPMKISDNGWRWISAKFAEAGLIDFFYNQVEPALFFGYSPLILKQVAATMCLLPLLLFYCLWRVMRAEDKTEKTGAARQQHWFVWAFLIWAGLSLLWSPTIIFSLRTYYSLVLFAFAFVILCELINKRSDWMKVVWAILIISQVLVIISLMQHLRLTRWFMIDWEGVRLRNRIGSFIGHNTGLSAFVMPSMFLSLGLLATKPSRAVKWWLRVYLVVFLFVIVAAQSRSVWAALALVTPIYYYLAGRWSGLKLGHRKVALGVGILIGVVLLQLVPFKYNPFYSKAAPFSQRVKNLLPESLRAETRLRILVCSGPLIIKRPLWGYGLGSFRYVYPKAQGDYLSNNPDTIIVPTMLRTIRAHDDWLQLLIELGLIGLGLAVAGIGLYFRDGWQRLRRTKDEWWRLMMPAVFAGLCAQLFQAFLDFPFHIAPTAYLICVMGALWVRGGALASPDEVDEKNKIEQDDQNAKPVGRLTLRPHKVLGLIFICFFIFPIPVHVKVEIPNTEEMKAETLSRWQFKFMAAEIMRFTLTPLLADTHHQKAMHIFNSAGVEGLSVAKRWDLIAQGFESIRKAQRMDFLNAEIRFEVANFRYQRGLMFYNLGQTALADGDPESAKNNFKMAQELFANSIRDINEAISMGYRYHNCFHLRALNWQHLEKIDPGKGALQNAKKDFYKAIHYSPSFAPALQDLSELLIKDPQTNAGEVYRLRGMISKYNPEWFKEKYIMKAYDAIYEQEYDKAIFMLRDLLKSSPEFVELYYALANTYLKMGEAQTANEVLMLAKSRGLESVELDKAWAFYYILIGRFDEGLKRLDELKKSAGKNIDPGLEILEWIALRQMGRIDELNARKEVVKSMVSDYDTYLLLEGTYLYETFKNREAGVKLWEEALELSDHPQSHLFAHLAQHYNQAGDTARARELLDEGLSLYPSDPMLNRLNKQIAPMPSETDPQTD